MTEIFMALAAFFGISVFLLHAFDIGLLMDTPALPSSDRGTVWFCAFN
jgi:hypothetical protein